MKVNFEEFEENMLRNLKLSTDQRIKNEEETVKGLNTALENRNNQVEQILNTRLSVCGFRDEHRGLGTVTFDYLVLACPAYILGKTYQVIIVGWAK
jgi:hypothetical protein